MAKNSKITCYIYCLINPINGSVFYVGRTFSDLNERLKSHISESKRKESKKNKIIQTLINLGSLPEIVLLEERKYMSRFFNKSGSRERFWIKHFAKTDSALCNIVGNPKVWTSEYRKKLCGTKSKPEA